eukprot:gnl/Chilomastix_caulleri/1236.p3 GENE.gnl/Chilomastix_caulleri/1236~~gnl/Chilomastix_caulleri/1236.p3  ORF type:complete len:56 (-),score=18.24 gnl/Chilomastix_caulleri/1236:303-470(-)
MAVPGTFKGMVSAAQRAEAWLNSICSLSRIFLRTRRSPDAGENLAEKASTTASPI